MQVGVDDDRLTYPDTCPDRCGEPAGAGRVPDKVCSPARVHRSTRQGGSPGLSSSLHTHTHTQA